MVCCNNIRMVVEYHSTYMDAHQSFNMLILQEPFIDTFGNTKATKDWRVVYPSSHLSDPCPPRSVILVSTTIDTNNWSQIHIPDTRDLVAIQISSPYGTLAIFNIYNDCLNTDTVNLLGSLLSPRQCTGSPYASDYMLWCGDFNCHHPMWDEERNGHLFTARALRDSESLLALVAEHNMAMLLPKDLPTLESMTTKNWTRPDNVFSSVNLEDKIMCCTTDPQLQGPGTDHVPILTAFELPVGRVAAPPTRNFRLADWEVFRKELDARLPKSPSPAPLTTVGSLQATVSKLTGALQDVIRTSVPLVRPSPHVKCWWNSQLAQLKKRKNKLNEASYRFRELLDHPSHEELWGARSEYSKAILDAKREHWSSFLEGLSYGEVWIAN